MAIDDNTSYELTGYQVKDLAGRIRLKADANSVPTSISDLGQVTSSDIDWSTMPGSYSTTEQKTPFTWIDGKPIYRKTINFGALPNATAKNVAHGISNLDEVVKLEGLIRNNRIAANPEWMNVPLVYRGSDSAYNSATLVSLTDVQFNCTQDRSHYSAYVTIWYTKTTD